MLDPKKGCKSCKYCLGNEGPLIICAKEFFEEYLRSAIETDRNCEYWEAKDS